MSKNPKPYSRHRYTAAQKEILCNLNIETTTRGHTDEGDKHAKKWQKKLAEKLADQIENDVENTLYNNEKVNKYREQAGLPKIKENDKPLITDPDLLTALSWFTSFRLHIVRLNGVIAAATGVGFLPKWFDILGLSYALELVIDLCDIGYTTFKPLRQQEEDLINKGDASRLQIYWWRFKNKILQDEELIPRMLNAAVWLSLNLASFILTGGFGGIIGTATVAAATTQLVRYMNIGGFIFDFVHEAAKGLVDFWRNSQTLVEVTKEIRDLKIKQKIYTKGYTLAPWSSLPKNKIKKAAPGTVYLSEKGDYVVRGLNGEIYQGTIDPKEIDLNKIHDLAFKQKILSLTTSAGHTVNTKPYLETAGKTDTDEYREVCKKCEKIDSKIQSRLVFEKKLEEKINWQLIPSRIYNWGITVIIGVGMGLLAAGAKALTLAGRCMSYIGGSVLGGLGKRLWWNYIVPACHKVKDEVVIPAYNLITDAISPSSTEIQVNQNNTISISSATPRAIHDNPEAALLTPKKELPKTEPIPIQNTGRNQNTRKITSRLQNNPTKYDDVNNTPTPKKAPSPTVCSTPDVSYPIEISSSKIHTRYNSSTSYPPRHKTGKQSSSDGIGVMSVSPIIVSPK